jgi:divalent metal cation (Fe/Co/Zn/Cd) transporter
VGQKPPFDPVWGAWILLLVLVSSVLLGQALVFLGCVLHSEAMCSRPLGNLTQIGMEVLTAIAILIGLGRPPKPPSGE